MNTDVMVKPATLMVSKVTVKDDKYTNILMGTVKAPLLMVFLIQLGKAHP